MGNTCTAHSGIDARLVQMEGRIDEVSESRDAASQALGRIEERTGSLGKAMAKVEARLEAIEKFNYRLLAAVMVIGGGAALIGAVLGVIKAISTMSGN